MDAGWITVLIMFAVNHLFTFGVIILLIKERRSLAKKLEKYREQVYEEYREQLDKD